MSVPTHLTLVARRRAIAAILEARFSVRALEEIRRQNTQYWYSARNDMPRRMYAEAMGEKQRLACESDEQVIAEVAAVRW
jgi:hypothetical protein